MSEKRHGEGEATPLTALQRLKWTRDWFAVLAGRGEPDPLEVRLLAQIRSRMFEALHIVNEELGAVSPISGRVFDLSQQMGRGHPGPLMSEAAETIDVAVLALERNAQRPSALPIGGNSLFTDGTPSEHEHYVSRDHIRELRTLQQIPNFDVRRLDCLLGELNSAWENKNWLTVPILVRTIVDFVAPLFGSKDFEQVVANWQGPSEKKILQTLVVVGKNAGNIATHRQIDTQSTMPVSQQADFRPAMAHLLEQVITALEKKKVPADVGSQSIGHSPKSVG